ncbi:stage 0 sporulation family protein [candidate division KSB1 bacterium]
MEEKRNDTEDNAFLSRGCCSTPKLYQRNEGVYKMNCSKLTTYDWLKDIKPPAQNAFEIIEVRFKNSRKDFFRICQGMDYEVGEFVAVEASPGHDIGIVSLTGEVVRIQMKKKNIDFKSDEIKKVYRKARLTDIEKWVAAVELENKTMYKARSISQDLDLDMKINDVEYQGDSTKAIFYYTAEERVDFRELIKILADEFKVRIEMRQIGTRQEASRLGGIGSCGRELCCCTWLTNFKSVTTNTARTQQLSLNPQKLAGQCGKLKCCLNYEFDHYVETINSFPNSEIILKTKKGEAIYHKTDIFKKLMWYSYIDDESSLLAIPVNKVREIIEQNEKGTHPEKLEDYAYTREQKTNYENVVGQDDLTRFDDD